MRVSTSFDQGETARTTTVIEADSTVLNHSLLSWLRQTTAAYRESTTRCILHSIAQVVAAFCTQLVPHLPRASIMGRALARPAALAAAMAACSSNLVPHADAFVPALHSPASSMSTFHGSGAAAASSAATRTRSRRPPSSSSVTIMKVAGAQPQQRDAWLEGRVKTRELFNALSQGEIGKRAFTQALAKRMMSKATGMQQDYELSEAASLAASSSAAVASTADLRCGSGVSFVLVSVAWWFCRSRPSKQARCRWTACSGPCSIYGVPLLLCAAYTSCIHPVSCRYSSLRLCLPEQNSSAQQQWYCARDALHRQQQGGGEGWCGQ